MEKCINILEVIKKLIRFLVMSISFEGLLAVTASILALLIPVALLVIENNGAGTESSFRWDKMVLFNQVINIKDVVWGLSLIIFPLVIWSDDIYWVNAIILIGYIVGLKKVWSLLKNSYSWIISKKLSSGNFRNVNRQEYIKGLCEEDFETQVEVWSLIWSDSKEREGMDESTLLELYFSQYSSITDYDKKRSFLLIYYKEFELKFNNFDETKDMLEKNFLEVLPEEDNEQFDNQKYLLWSLSEQIFLETTNQAINSANFQYSYKIWLNNFLSKLSTRQYNEFLTSVGMKLIETLRLSVTRYDYYELDKILPDMMVYDKVKGNVRKKVLTNIFMVWLRNSYAIISEKELKDKLFANKIFEFMFLKLEPIAFFRIIGFSIFINDFVYDNQALENRILAYASEPNLFIGMGRIHSLSKELDRDSFEENFTYEKNLTYHFIFNLDEQGYYYLQNEEKLNSVVCAIKRVKTQKINIDDLGLARLNGVYSELAEYQKLIRQKLI